MPFKFKIFVTLTLFILSTLNAFADVSFHRAGNAEPLKVSDIKPVLNGYLKDYPDKDILFYIHGRSRTLEKEIRRSAQIEKIHGLKVLMMHWDSWSSTITRPTDHAENSGDELRDAINEIREFKEENHEIFQHKKIFILFHSMGNLILKSYVENFYDDTLNSKLFDATIMNAPDAPYRNHKDWLSKVHLSENQYILMNKNDAVLNASKLLDIRRDNLFDDRIGLGIKFYFHSNKILANNVLYFDITRASGFAHAHFVSRNPEVFKILRYIFTQKNKTNTQKLLAKNNEPVKLNPFFVIKNVYYFKD